MSFLQEEVDSLKQIRKEYARRGEQEKALAKENEQLKQRLLQARQEVAALKPTALKVKTRAFPSTLTGENVRLALAAEGGSPPYTWEYAGTLPDGLSLDQPTGMLTGQTRKQGEYAFTVQVTDAAGRSASSPGAIRLSVVKRPEEQKKGVSPGFILMSVITSLLLMYILWKRYQAYRHYQEMRAKGLKLVWTPD